MKMKAIALGIVAVMIIAGGLAAVDAGNGNNGPKPGIDFNGPHFNLNLIGKSKEMPGDKDNPDRHVMFVPLDTTGMTFDINTPNNLGQTTMDGIKIEMTQSIEEDGWAMIDGDATDGYGAFELAAGRYQVYIAVKAKSPKYVDPHTDITGWVEAYDNTGALWYYIDVGSVTVRKGKNKWTDATDLFFVSTTEDDFGFLTGGETNYFSQYGGMWVFEYMSGLDTWYEDSGGASGYNLSSLAYFWQLNNYGNKLIQVRFYEI